MSAAEVLIGKHLRGVSSSNGWNYIRDVINEERLLPLDWADRDQVLLDL